MHLTNAFAVTGLYELRRLGYKQKPPRGASKAAEMRWEQVVFIKKKVTVAEICAAWSMNAAATAAVGPTVDGWSSATQLEQFLSSSNDAADACWAAVGSYADKR